MKKQSHQNQQTSLFMELSSDSMKKPSAAGAAEAVRHRLPKQSEPIATTADTAVPAQTTVKPRSQTPVAAGRSRSSLYDAIYKNLIEGVRAYFDANRFQNGVIGVSGGVDSALSLKIAADALGAANITALLMPELGITRQENIDHAKILCQFLGVKFHYQPINNFLTDFNITPWKPSPGATMNTKARVRAVLLYSAANTENALVLGTSNKSEILLGYGTKYGDLAADLEVIGDLFKTEVVGLADHIGLPPEIVFKTPTAELAPGQTDEKELGAAYKDLDQVLEKIELGPDGCIERGLPAPLVQMVFRRVEANKHKTLPAPVLKIR